MAEILRSVCLPIVVLLAVTLVSGAFSAGFDWLYPLRVLATGAVLLCFWRALELRSYRPAWEPVLAGIVVFGLWLLTVPKNADADAAFSLALAQSIPAITIGWLLMRSIGSIITRPIACITSTRLPDAVSTSAVPRPGQPAWLAATTGGYAPHSSPHPPGSSWSTIKRLYDTGSSRTPSRLAHQARPIR